MRLSVKRSFWSAAVVAAFTVFACVGTHANVAAETALRVGPVTIDQENVATFEVTNTAAAPIAATEALGFTYLYFNVEIESPSGKSTELSNWELLRELPPRCLQPNETLVFRIPLKSWTAVRGTNATCNTGRCSRYDLLKGTYRIRAIYRPPPESGFRTRCARVNKFVSSEWTTFSIE